jgi:hypothetical protein
MTPPHDDYYERYSKPSDILGTIGEYISDLDLITTIKENTPLYRGRMHNRTEIIDNAKDLGAPPSCRAKSSN